MKGKRLPTIYDLAQFTGYSPGTISRVLNNRDKVRPSTRETVLKAVKRFEFRPRVSVRKRQIAILSEQTDSNRMYGYSATLAAYLAFACSQKNIGYVFPEDPLTQLSEEFLDGVIAVTHSQELARLLELVERRVPVVYFDEFGTSSKRLRVNFDHYNAGALAANYFLDQGKRRLAFFGAEAPNFHKQLRGYREAIERKGVLFDRRLVVMAGQEVHSSGVARLVREGADAIYVPGASLQAMKCLNVLSYVMGVQVPQEVAIIGGVGKNLSSLLVPPLTTIEEPLHEMAQSAVTMLDRYMSGMPLRVRSITVAAKLIERNSVEVS